MSKHLVDTASAPRAIGPYSQAIRAGEWLFLSGQIALDPATGKMIEGNAAEQSERVLNNLDAVLKAAGASLGHVVKTTIYLTNLEDFSEVNKVYAAYFPSSPPARATVEVSRLPKDAKVEIAAIAYTQGCTALGS